MPYLSCGEKKDLGILLNLICFHHFLSHQISVRLVIVTHVQFWAKMTHLLKMSKKLHIYKKIQVTMYQYLVWSSGKLWGVLGLKNGAINGYFSRWVIIDA